MRYFGAFYNYFPVNKASHLFKALFSFEIFSHQFSRKLSNLIAQAKRSVFLQNFLLFVCLLVTPIGGVFVKDYVNDRLEAREIEETAQKSLIASAEPYAQMLNELKNKILSEKLYQNKKAMHQLLMDVNALQTYGESSFPRISGLQWISADLKAIGLYGEIRNFDPKLFLSFLRLLDKTPNTIQIININNAIYLWIGMAEGSDIIGYLLLPFPLDTLLNSENIVKLRTFLVVPKLNIPTLGVPLEEVIKNSSTYFQISIKNQWRAYGLQNVLAYSIFLIFAVAVLFFKRKNDAKKESEVFQLTKKTDCLTQNLLAQQKAANLILHRLHDINESIGEISNVFLESHSSTTIFTEQEQMNFIRKVCDFSADIEQKVIKKGSQEDVDLQEIITECLHFYGQKLFESHIGIKQEHDLSQSTFLTDRDAFTQLMLNLFHKALERTPEHGSILIRLTKPERVDEGLFVVTIKDNGYSFSSAELSQYKKPNQPLFEDYFDLEWGQVLELAKTLNCELSSEKVPLGKGYPYNNKITLIIHEQKTIEDESVYEKYAAQNNIIRLFPTS